MKREADMILYADSVRGVYIPQHFAESIKRDKVSGIDMQDLDYLARGPNDIAINEQDDNPEPHDSEWYWEVWQDVLDNAVVDVDGKPYTLYQDGDLWLIEPDAIFNGEGADEQCKDIDTLFYIDDGQEEHTDNDD